MSGFRFGLLLFSGRSRLRNTSQRGVFLDVWASRAGKFEVAIRPLPPWLLAITTFRSNFRVAGAARLGTDDEAANADRDTSDYPEVDVQKRNTQLKACASA